MTTDTLALGKWHEAAADPVQENTVYFSGGGIKIGVEYRRPTPEDFAHIKGVKGEPDEGLSLHVFSATDGVEYLRFDRFEKYPHYHYMTPGKGQVHFVYDEVANGEMLAWSLERLHSRLTQMLTLAGMTNVADLDLEKAKEAVDQAGAHAREVLAQAK